MDTMFLCIPVSPVSPISLYSQYPQYSLYPLYLCISRDTLWPEFQYFKNPLYLCIYRDTLLYLFTPVLVELVVTVGVVTPVTLHIISIILIKNVLFFAIFCLINY